MYVCTQTTDGTSKVGLYHPMFKATFREALKDDQMKKKLKLASISGIQQQILRS